MTDAERKLPGVARSADEVMEDYRQYRGRLNPVLATLLAPDLENIYRWRVQYDCGCIDEQLATNDNIQWLLAHSHTDPLSRERLPARTEQLSRPVDQDPLNQHGELGPPLHAEPRTPDGFDGTATGIFSPTTSAGSRTRSTPRLKILRTGPGLRAVPSDGDRQ